MNGRRLHGRRGLKSPSIPAQSGCGLSPPSRAAWIEISVRKSCMLLTSVAAFTGGVD